MGKHLTKKVRSRIEHGLKNIVVANSPVLQSAASPDIQNTDRIGAHELFSLFTESIIKKKTTFTR